VDCSFTTDLSLEFDPTSAINISSILIDTAAKGTHSDQPLIIVPDFFGKITLQTVEFNVNLAGSNQKQYKNGIFF
jgi:hypothetical protein